MYFGAGVIAVKLSRGFNRWVVINRTEIVYQGGFRALSAASNISNTVIRGFVVYVIGCHLSSLGFGYNAYVLLGPSLPFILLYSNSDALLGVIESLIELFLTSNPLNLDIMDEE